MLASKHQHSPVHPFLQPRFVIVWHAPIWQGICNAQLHCVSCKTVSGVGVSLLITDTSRPNCCCCLSSKDLDMIGSKTTSRGQLLACTCVRLIGSNHSSWLRGSLSDPYAWFTSLNRYHQRSYTWVMWSHLGHNGVHNNSSQTVMHFKSSCER